MGLVDFDCWRVRSLQTEKMNQDLLLKLLVDFINFNPRIEQQFLEECVEMGYAQEEVERLLDEWINKHQ